jgi:beta-lactamase class D
MRELEVGGKTGSLTGLEPKGRNDWFVGYADRGDKAIAFASLTVNKERWTIKSAVVARKVIEAYFDSEE